MQRFTQTLFKNIDQALQKWNEKLGKIQINVVMINSELKITLFL